MLDVLKSQLKGLEGTFTEGSSLNARAEMMERKYEQIHEDYKRMRKENDRLELIIYTCFKNNAKNDQWIGGLEQALRNISSFNAIEAEISHQIDTDTKVAFRRMKEKRKADREKRKLQAETVDKVAEQLLAKIKLKEAYLDYEKTINSSVISQVSPSASPQPVKTPPRTSTPHNFRIEKAFHELGSKLSIENPLEEIDNLLNIIERKKELEMEIARIKDRIEKVNEEKGELVAQWEVASAVRKEEDVYFDFLKIQSLEFQLKSRQKTVESTESRSSQAATMLAHIVQYLSETAKTLHLPFESATAEDIATRLEQMISSIALPKSDSRDMLRTMTSRSSAINAMISQEDWMEDDEDLDGKKFQWVKSKNLEALKELLR